MANEANGADLRIDSCWQTGQPEKIVTQEDVSVSHCARILPGSSDCSNQVDKNKCTLSGPQAECTGRIHAAGANVEQGKKLFKLKRLNDYRSTGVGLGHLSTMRAVHSSPIPFSKK